jgi:hypothetical protein
MGAMPYFKRKLHSREVERSRTIFACIARLSFVNIQQDSLTVMGYQCPACNVKPYDKDWKLRRHQDQTDSCFKSVYPDKPLPTRFKCSECEYESPRAPDFKRHLQRVHRMGLETAESRVLKSTCPTHTSSQTSTQVDRAATPDLQQIASSSGHQDQSLQPVVKNLRPNRSAQPISDPSTGSRTLRTLYPTPCLQRAIPPINQEGPGEIKRIDIHLISQSHPPTTKRKNSDLFSLPKQCKRLHNRVNHEYPDVANGTYGTRSKDMFTVVAHDTREQGSDTDVVQDDRTDIVDQDASELVSRASSVHPQPPSRNQSASRLATISIPAKITVSHDTSSTENSRSLILEKSREAHWRVLLGAS